MEYTLEQLRNKFYENVYNVYEIFKNHFGEDYVDLQKIPDNEKFKEIVDAYRISDKYTVTDNDIDYTRSLIARQYCDIIVWWPKVTVTNEHNKSIDIQDLYAKVTINIYGLMPYESWGFYLNRSTYTSKQFNSNYLHSHVRSIPMSNLKEFTSPCLGRGPILETIKTLKKDNDEVIWMLFCEELSRYVTVESLTGVPYKRLEEVGHFQDDILYRYEPINKDDLYSLSRGFLSFPSSRYAFTRNTLYDTIRDFMAYYLKNGHLSFNFKYGYFILGMPYYDYIIDISNSFIDFYNKELKEDEYKINHFFDIDFLRKRYSCGRKIKMSYRGNGNQLVHRYIGKEVLTFKNTSVLLKILEDNGDTGSSEVTVLHQVIANYILTTILTILNYKFKKDGNTEPSQTGETICYI